MKCKLDAILMKAVLDKLQSLAQGSATCKERPDQAWTQKNGNDQFCRNSIPVMDLLQKSRCSSSTPSKPVYQRWAFKQIMRNTAQHGYLKSLHMYVPLSEARSPENVTSLTSLVQSLVKVVNACFLFQSVYFIRLR
ncbi:hypothetical protein GOP47_0003534 [Adiantum capillus-veneris]|uniref:Uncharacterized protein n=1 Tax=Adiantum capillus-veneris TaxID=13818 RepID=A0A9D4VC53_ADICA|nr:hypothetical protein GOP47_0003534 [Adiantum capillus-veneris]